MLKFIFAYCDAAEAWQLDFQDPATPVMGGIINLHHDIMFFLVTIFVLATFIFCALLVKANVIKYSYKLFYQLMIFSVFLGSALVLLGGLNLIFNYGLIAWADDGDEYAKFILTLAKYSVLGIITVTGASLATYGILHYTKTKVAMTTAK
jgi:hypothetical protein